MAGYDYHVTPPTEKEERYDVSTGIRRIGPYVLDSTSLVVGDYLPSFAPICADLKYKKCNLVRNMKVYEAYTNGDTALTIKVAKGSFPYVGMYIGNGSKGATISAVDKSNSSFDLITIAAAFGANLAIGDVLFEATANGGTTQKYKANSALYGKFQITKDVNIVSLLRAAAEIEPDKLDIPFSSNDKSVLGTNFQFNE